MKKSYHIVSIIFLYFFYSSTCIANGNDEKIKQLASIGYLFGHAVKCGEPYKAIKPYVSYMSLMASGGITNKEEKALYFDAFLKEFTLAVESAPINQCQRAMLNLDKMKKATHDFRNELTPSTINKLGLKPLPPL